MTDGKETGWDKLLKIRTVGRDDSRSDQYYYPYEPTPYCVLERLADTGYITKKNKLIDYGCGKGRVEFFLSYQTRCQSIGVEYDRHIFRGAMDNHKTAVSRDKTLFQCINAEDYLPPADADRFYFFNPFSVKVFQKVLGKILNSYYEDPREMLLFFYYPSEEYVAFLMTAEPLVFYNEVDCRDLFPGNDQREKILIFSIDG